MPAGLAKLVGQKGVNWDYNTAPEPQLDDRSLWWPRGKVLGGSSSINAMCYIRGDAARLRRMGRSSAPKAGTGTTCCPTSSAAKATRAAPSTLHGGDGPLGVSDLRYQQSAVAGVHRSRAPGRLSPPTDDFNGARQDGVGLYQVTTRDGARCSSGRAYLKPVRRSRANLTVHHRRDGVSRITFDGRPRQRRGLCARRQGRVLPGAPRARCCSAAARSIRRSC